MRSTLCMLLFSTACSGGHGVGDPGDDADAGVVAADAGRATRDGGRDGGVDGGDLASDGGADAGRAEEPAGWVPVEGLPSGCVVEWARHPEEVWTPTLEPCPEDEPCRRVVVNGLGFAGANFLPGVGAHDGEVGFCVGGVDFSLRELQTKTVLVSTAPATFAAWRNARLSDPGVCSVTEVAITEGGRSASWVIQTFGGDFPSTAHVYHASLRDLTRPHAPVVSLDASHMPGTSNVNGLSASDTTIVVRVGAAGRLYRIDVGTRDMVLLTESPLAIGTPVRPQVIGDDVYWEDWRSGGAVVLRSVDGGPVETLLDDERVHHIGVAVDDDRITWQRAENRGPDGRWGQVELFTADLNDVPLAPRSLGTLDGYSNLYGAGGGQYVFVWDGIEVIEVATGRHRRYSIPPGSRVGGGPMYVTEDELMIRITLHENDGGSAKLIDLTRLPVVD